MTLQQRIKTWQEMALHHALPYYGLAVAIEQILLQTRLHVVRAHVLTTWMETPDKTALQVAYRGGKRFNGQRIEIRINGGNPSYYGPDDMKPIHALLRSIA